MNSQKTVKVVALRKTYYGGDRQEGEEFEMKPEHLRIMTATKAVKVVDPPKRRYERRDMRAED